ncbi:MAG: hypothetical protein ABH851_02425 [Methanobacteriota archaeon]
MVEKKSSRKPVIVIILAVVFFIGGYYITRPSDDVVKPSEYPISEIMYGTRIYSKIPLEQVALWDDIVLFNSELPGAVACNLEITTLKGRPSSGLYSVEILEGDAALFIDERRAVIQGVEKAEILYNCHVLGCLLTNISCPEKLGEIQKIIWESQDINVIVDSKMSAASVGAYAEIMGPLGFHQMMIADVNSDGTVDDLEIAANKLFIYPYIKFNETCELQPLKNFLQDANTSSNLTRDCNISPSIYFEESEEKELKIEGDRIILRGDEYALKAAAIIAGNIIAPDWITSFRQAN